MEKRTLARPITLLTTALTTLTHNDFASDERHAIGLHFAPFVAAA